MQMNGLNNKQVETSRKVYGTNKINEAEPKKFWSEWLANFEDPMLKLLVGITILMAVIAALGFTEWFEVIGILVSVTIVTLISTKTAMTSDGEYRKLKKQNSHEECKVYRNGKVEIIDVNDIVVGDLVIVQSGEKVFADGYLYHGNIKVDNSALNGESEEVKKHGIEEYEFDNGEMTDAHMLMRGALVVDGDGVMKVVKVGMKTMMGKMAEEMNEDEVDSPLKVKLTKLADQISKFGYIGAVVIGLAILGNSILSMGFNEWIGQPIPLIIKDVLNAVLVAITIIVMAVPEGLPLMIAIVLMQNTSKMLQHSVLVRKAVGIETAGSLNILFSDKTGTITKGKLEVVNFIDSEANEYKSIKELPEVLQEYVVTNLHVNNGAMFVDGNVVGGNMTDRALLEYAKDVTPKAVEVHEVETFNSTNKYMATSVQWNSLATITLYKGAVEKILDRCTNVSPQDLETINTKVEEMANNSIRVLAIAYGLGGIKKGTLPNAMTLLGVVGIRDDVRPEAKSAIKEVQEAGVQVVMITGDRKETAVAIAKDSGLIQQETDVVLTSQELGALSDDEVKALIPNLRVVARALPTDKSRLVRLSQELGLVAGMTGDGVNDSPALKRADVGFAMGSGTDAAKEAGDIVILDDNFKSIADSILYGRTIYNNIMKFIKFQLTINVVAVFICAVCPFFGIQEPLNIVQLLILNLVMDSLGAMALGGEPALKEYMNEKPKSRTQSIVTKDMMGQVLITGAFMVLLSLIFLFSNDFKVMFGEAHLTGYFALFMLMSVWNGFNVRSADSNVFKGLKENPMFTKVMVAIVGILVVLVYIGGDFLEVVPMNLSQWIIVTLISLIVIPFGSLVKSILAKITK